MRIWLFSLLISLGLPALAALTVSDGDNQILLAGSASDDVAFKVVDELGNPTSGATVNFNLTDSTGDPIAEALSKNTADTDSTGEVITQIKSLEKIGTYTLTATLATDKTQSASTEVTVIVGQATTLTITDGANQVIQVEQHSKNIQFQLTDAFGHAIKDTAIFFTLVPPELDKTSELKPISAITDKNGQATTRLKADTLGSYLIIAHSSANSSLLASTKVFVTDSIPVLPELGNGQAVDALGQPVKPMGQFMGDISVVSNTTKDKLQPDDLLFIQGIITPNNEHIGETADIIVIAGYIPFLYSNMQLYYMLDNQGKFLQWAGTPASIVAFKPNITLSKTQVVNIYTGQPSTTGTLDIWFGYRLKDGTIVVNFDHPMSVTVSPPELGEAQAITASGRSLKTTADFRGGILVEGRFEENLQTDDIVSIQGLIKPDSAHIGKPADIIVAVQHIPSLDIGPDEPFVENEPFVYLLNRHGELIEWDGEIASIIAFKHNVSLSETQAVDIYNGELPITGTLEIWFGYRLENGAIIYNDIYFPIYANIKKPPQSSSTPSQEETADEDE
jgi:hypothetical protein